jgi:hypothetical protein
MSCSGHFRAFKAKAEPVRRFRCAQRHTIVLLQSVGPYLIVGAVDRHPYGHDRPTLVTQPERLNRRMDLHIRKAHRRHRMPMRRCLLVGGGVVVTSSSNSSALLLSASPAPNLLRTRYRPLALHQPSPTHAYTRRSVSVRPKAACRTPRRPHASGRTLSGMRCSSLRATSGRLDGSCSPTNVRVRSGPNQARGNGVATRMVPQHTPPVSMGCPRRRMEP